MNQAVAVKDQLKSVGAVLERMKMQMAAELPKHLTPERMVRVALAAAANTPKLLECDRDSFYKAVLQCCRVGLEPDGILGQAYLVPFAGKVQFIPGYKGLIDLARRSGEVLNIIAKEVCENDDFALAWHETPPFRHVQDPRGNRGQVIGFWALANFRDGGFHFDYMPVQEVIDIRDASSGYKAAVAWSKNPKNKYNFGVIDSPWEKHFVEMGKKTVIRRIAKYLPMSVQKAAAIESAVEQGKHAAVGDFGELVIEGEASEVGEEIAPATSGKLDAFAAAETQHDPNTGEVIEAASAPMPPPQILPPMKDGANDWEIYAVLVESALEHADEIAWVDEFEKKNAKTLKTLAGYKDFPPADAAKAAIEKRKTELGGV